MKRENELIIEKELKKRLAFQCVHSVKTYAKKKEATTKSRPLRVLLRNFIINPTLDYSFALHVSILFAHDYDVIKDKVKSGEFSLEHISREDYWESKGPNVGREEALFFLYTFMNELYPDTAKDIEVIAERVGKKENVLEIIQEFIIKSK